MSFAGRRAVFLARDSIFRIFKLVYGVLTPASRAEGDKSTPISAISIELRRHSIYDKSRCLHSRTQVSAIFIGEQKYDASLLYHAE